jgi:hypothetical protein
MIELPYFKFFPSQWVTGDINYISYELQGAFIQACCHYWSKECDMDYNKLTMRVDKKYIDQLIELKLITNNKKITIKFMDEQYKERQTAHNLRVENGRKGGNATAKLKKSSSNTKALKKDKKIKDNYANDNVLKVSDEVKKLLTND